LRWRDFKENRLYDHTRKKGSRCLREDRGRRRRGEGQLLEEKIVGKGKFKSHNNRRERKKKQRISLFQEAASLGK